MIKQTLGWTAPKLRSPEAADRWTWLIIAATPSSGSPATWPPTSASPGSGPPARAAHARPGPPGVPEHPPGQRLPGRCTETQPARPRTPARVDEPPPRTPP